MCRARVVALLFLGMLGPPMGGCVAGTESADEPATGAGEDEIRASVLGRVAAVRINGGATVAAPGKMQRVLENIGLSAGTPRPPEGGVRCPPSYRLEFLDTKGAVKATAGFLCGGPGARKNAQGSVQINGRSYLVTAGDVDALDAIGQEPRAIGDVLFGVDRVQIGKPGAPDQAKETRDGALVAKMMRALRADQVPDPYARVSRCLPARSVSFFRGSEIVGSASFSCSDVERGVVGGSFSARGLNGGVLVDAEIVFGVESAIRR